MIAPEHSTQHSLPSHTAFGDRERVPSELRGRPQWVVWRLEARGGKPTKVPYTPSTGVRASSTDPATWETFPEALEALESDVYSGLGFDFSVDDPYTGVDLDEVRDRETGELTPEARAIVDTLDSYAEVSPSGVGVHVFVKGALPVPGKRRGGIEAYSSGRYFTVTGDAISEARNIPERGEELLNFYQEHLEDKRKPLENGDSSAPSAPLDDQEIIDRARQAGNGDKFERLMRGDLSDCDGDHSRADEAFVWRLWFWTQDPEQIKRIHSQSGLSRGKSTRRRDYLDRSIRNASKSGMETYDWNPPRAKGAETPGEGAPARTGGKPNQMELVRRYQERRPDVAYGVGSWRRCERGVWGEIDTVEVEKGILEIIKEAIPEGITPSSNLLSSVVNLLRVEVQIPPQMWAALGRGIIVCQNGTLELEGRKFREHRREDYALFSVAFDYDPDARAETWEAAFKDRLGGSWAFLQEYAGYSLTTRTDLEAAFLVGAPGCGKSTFIEGVEMVAGDQAGTLSLSDMERSLYALSNIGGKTLLTATEAPHLYLKSTATLDALISGEKLQIERKYQQPERVRPVAKILWAMNELPQVRP